MKILIPTCNDYIKHIEALQHSTRNTYLSKFEFIIIGDKAPEFELDSNWSFVSVGVDSPASKWSTRMIEFLKDFPDEDFIYGCDDCAITFLDGERLKQSLFVMSHFDGIGRIALMAEGKNRAFEDCPVIRQGEDIGDLVPFKMSRFGNDSDYRLSLGWSIYNKKCFLEFCEAGMTPWQFELQSCDIKNKERLDKWAFLTFLPEGEVIDAAFFRRKHIQGVIPDWHKGYYGRDLEGKLKDEVEQILFKK